jgi:hypothetical protein
MGTLDYTVVHGSTVYAQGDDVPDEVIDAIQNPATSSTPAVEDGQPKPSAKVATWQDYAEKNGVVVPEGATKAEIISAVEAAASAAGTTSDQD